MCNCLIEHSLHRTLIRKWQVPSIRTIPILSEYAVSDSLYSYLSKVWGSPIQTICHILSSVELFLKKPCSSFQLNAASRDYSSQSILTLRWVSSLILRKFATVRWTVLYRALEVRCSIEKWDRDCLTVLRYDDIKFKIAASLLHPFAVANGFLAKPDHCKR